MDIRPNSGNITAFSNSSSAVSTVAKSFYLPLVSQGSHGRVVKAMNLKSIGVSPRRFESCPTSDRYHLSFVVVVAVAF